MLRIAICLLAALLATCANAQQGGGSSNDPYVLGEFLVTGGSTGPENSAGYNATFGLTSRTKTINGSLKTLVLLVAGASNGAAWGPSAFVPTNASVIDNFNIYDSNNYPSVDPLLGQARSNIGPGSVSPHVADTLITNGSFNRVILVPTAIGSTTTQTWASGVLSNRLCVAMKRLASQGITPATTGVTFGLLWMIGENEHDIAQATYQANVRAATTAITACGFSGRIFIPEETIAINVADATIQAAQTGLVDNVTYFSGGNLDSLTGGTNRQADGTHFNATGQASAATLIYNALHASGSPY